MLVDRPNERLHHQSSGICQLCPGQQKLVNPAAATPKNHDTKYHSYWAKTCQNLSKA